MVNTLYLEEKITASGKKKSFLAEKIGCSRQYFYKKCNNEAPFTTDDVMILCDELNITKLAERKQIFLF
jgi:hypothetical protein